MTPDGPPWIEEGAPPVVAAVVVLTCNRPDYLQRTLTSIAKYANPPHSSTCSVSVACVCVYADGNEALLTPWR